MMSVLSDSINLVELDLLGTLTTVNSAENMVMTDDLLDLELKPITLSQPKQLSAVLQVPYKRFSCFQIDQS